MTHHPAHDSHFLAPRTCRACRRELGTIGAIYVLCYVLVALFFSF